jgi:hypothetical protein
MGSLPPVLIGPAEERLAFQFGAQGRHTHVQTPLRLLRWFLDWYCLRSPSLSATSLALRFDELESAVVDWHWLA